MINLFKFNKNEFNLKKIAKKPFQFWIKRRQAFFIIISLAVFGLGIYFSYINLYKNPWNEEKKNQYINSQRQDINFKEDSFGKVIQEINKKKENFQKDFPPVKDIFKSLGE